MFWISDDPVAFIQPTPAVAQIATIIETQVPEQYSTPTRGARSRYRNKTNPYFGLRSSFQNVRQYYSNPVKTIPGIHNAPSFITTLLIRDTIPSIRIASYLESTVWIWLALPMVSVDMAVPQVRFSTVRRPLSPLLGSSDGLCINRKQTMSCSHD